MKLSDMPEVTTSMSDRARKEQPLPDPKGHSLVQHCVSYGGTMEIRV
jgi:hypothetical protein